MASGLVKALWVAGFHAELPNGTALIPGETVCQITEGEAAQSDNWQLVPAKTKPADSGDKE